RPSEDTERDVVVPARRDLTGQRERRTQDQTSGGHHEPGPPAVVEPAGERREDEEQQPAESVAERRLPALPPKLSEQRDIEDRERRANRPGERIDGRGDADQDPAIPRRSTAFSAQRCPLRRLAWYQRHRQ